MLAAELRGEPYVKTRVNAEVQKLTGRSRTSVEYKFQNISAVLIDYRHPFVNGYKPASNYQESLVDIVAAGLARHADLDQLAFASVTAAPDMVWAKAHFHLVEAPHGDGRLPRASRRAAVKRDFDQIENNNTRLGLAGELAVLSWEQRRLVDLGRPDLAERVEHVSVTKGDDLGYDIRSFAAVDEERFIEVKTTRRNPYWPMLISRNEVDFSQEAGDAFALYRVFEFGSGWPGLFQLPGSVTSSCTLDAITYEAVPA
jgi:hypothetical protein